MSSPPPPRHPVPDHIPEALREAFATTRGAPIPPHSPFQRGDAVQRLGHTTPGGPPEPGFRGWAVGTVGATILTGITISGEEWWENWGALHPDGQPADLRDHCSYCRKRRRLLLAEQDARQHGRGEQLDLFSIEDSRS